MRKRSGKLAHRHDVENDNIEHSVTTYKTNAFGSIDGTVDVWLLTTRLGMISSQFGVRCAVDRSVSCRAGGRGAVGRLLRVHA